MPISAGDVIAGGVATVIALSCIAGAIQLTFDTILAVQEEPHPEPRAIIGVICVLLCFAGVVVSFMTAKHHFKRRRPRGESFRTVLHENRR